MCHCQEECMNANKFSLVFFLYLVSALFYSSSHQFFYHEFFFGKKSHHCEPWFYVFQGYVTENLYSIFRYILYVCE